MPWLSTPSGVANAEARGQFELSVAERIQFDEGLWDSVAGDTGDLPLTDAQNIVSHSRAGGPLSSEA